MDLRVYWVKAIIDLTQISKLIVEKCRMQMTIRRCTFALMSAVSLRRLQLSCCRRRNKTQVISSFVIFVAMQTWRTHSDLLAPITGMLPLRDYFVGWQNLFYSVLQVITVLLTLWLGMVFILEGCALQLVSTPSFVVSVTMCHLSLIHI